MTRESSIDIDYVSTDLISENGTVLEWATILSTTATSPAASADGGSIPFPHRLVVGACCCLITITGLLGSALVIVSVLRFKKLQTITNILVFNLAIADFMTCLFLPFSVVGLVDDSGEYPLPDLVCAITPGVSFTCLAVSISTLAFIAAVRWYVITKSVRGTGGVYTHRNIIFLVLVIWVACISIVTIPLLFGVGELGYSRYYSLCSVTDTNPLRGVYVLMQSSFIIIVLIATCIFYALIVAYVLRENRKLRSHFSADMVLSGGTKGNTTNERNMTASLNKREVEITKNLFIVVCVFAICMVPNGVNFLIEGTSVATLYGAMISTANSVVNPVIYGLKHPNFQEAFKNIICFRTHNARAHTSTGKSNSTALD
ncbi:nociceptin receptor-like [Diadema setosum]|uniref:nociceptin receptor-like n=1 Tax=Diadema setosum TaxID=31175 RepID=UPI003B3B21AC